MALLGTLRDKMGIWVTVFVFVAISAFVLGDLFSANSNILNWGKDTVGEIAGEEISISEFQAAVDERVTTFIMQNGFEPNENHMIGIRQQAWDLLVARLAIVPEFEKVGVMVTDREVADMISGKNIFEGIRQSFTNQETGEFDRAALGNYLNQLEQMGPGTEQYMRWQMFQKDLRPSRERIKYENLLLKSSYVTKAEAEREYHLQNDVAEVRYLYVPYHAIAESEVTLSDDAYRNYYNKNKERFKTDGVRDLKYVVFDVLPSAEDSASVQEILRQTVEEFKNNSNDSIYAFNHTEGDAPFEKYHPGNLPEFLTPDQLTEGNVIGPVLRGDTYYVAKISEVLDDTEFAARASHILIRPVNDDESSKREAREQATKILNEIRAGADFAAKAREFGTDGTRENGGDLGWFSSGQMVEPFEKAVFSATKPGLLPNLVETDFGYHIVSVTEPKTNRAYKIALVEQQILPSDASLNDAFRKAETFSAGLSGVSEFEQRAKESGFAVMEAKNITAGDRRVGALGESRQVVQWLYRDASRGEVSQVFDLGEQYVVAVMTNAVEKGYKPLEAVREEIKPHILKEAQGDKIIEKLKGIAGTLDEKAQGFGDDATVYSNSDVRLSSNALPTVGFDPKVVGTIFALDNGKTSAPVKGENGVVIVETQNRTVAPELSVYNAYKEQLEQNTYNFGSMNIAEAIRQHAGIEDERYKFY